MTEWNVADLWRSTGLMNWLGAAIATPLMFILSQSVVDDGVNGPHWLGFAITLVWTALPLTVQMLELAARHLRAAIGSPASWTLRRQNNATRGIWVMGLLFACFIPQDPAMTSWSTVGFKCLQVWLLVFMLGEMVDTLRVRKPVISRR
ncbi:MAG: hypothetical protein AAFU56_02245 [Pseudomonadota bacterium]